MRRLLRLVEHVLHRMFGEPPVIDADWRAFNDAMNRSFQ